MRIVVNNIAASTGGALTVLIDFYDFLVSNDEAKKHEWVFLLSDRYILEQDNIEVIVLKKNKKWIYRLLFDFLTGREVISNLKPDIVFSMQNTITYGVKQPSVLFVQQSIPFQSIKKFSFFKRSEIKLFIYQYIIGELIKKSIRASELVVVQTRWMKTAICESMNIAKSKILLAFPIIQEVNNKSNNCDFNRKSFFYPANSLIYKNHECIDKAVTILLNDNIVDFEVLLTTERETKNYAIKNYGEMRFDDVIKQYNISTLVFPSYIETVGLPLVESRQVGGLILAADTCFSREVLENYENVYYFDPFIAEELANLMRKVINGEIVKKNKVTIINEYFTHSSWGDVVRAIIELGDPLNER